MVVLSSVNFKNSKSMRNTAFGRKKAADSAPEEQQEGAKLMYEEKKNHPVKTALKIEADKLVKAFTTYPAKGFSGSKNSDFYEFLTMGIAPYLIGSGMMIGVFNLANKYFDPQGAGFASKKGRQMAAGVVLYGLFKTLSKKFIETPLNMKYGIDVNVPYRRKVDELPEERNRKNLTAYQYHKAYESVDFPYWDLFTNNKSFGKEREAYFKDVGKRMGFSDEELKYPGQKVKPLIREKLVQARAFTSLSSYLWGAIGVGIAMQKPFERFRFPNPVNGIKSLIEFVSPSSIKKGIAELKSNSAALWRTLKDTSSKRYGERVLGRLSCFIPSGTFYNATKPARNLLSDLSNGFKEFIGSDKAGVTSRIMNKVTHKSLNGINKPAAKHIAGRLLFAAAAGVTLLGNILTLTDFNKNKKDGASAAVSLIDENRRKEVC